MAWVSAAEPDLQQKMLLNISTFVTKIFGPAAEDVVRDGGELVRDPVGYPRPHAGPAVRPNHHSAIKLYCTQSCSRGHLFTSRKPVGRKCIFAHSGEVLERCNGCHYCLLK